jgi:hypothetical protein
LTSNHYKNDYWRSIYRKMCNKFHFRRYVEDSILEDYIYRYRYIGIFILTYIIYTHFGIYIVLNTQHSIASTGYESQHVAIGTTTE